MQTWDASCRILVQDAGMDALCMHVAGREVHCRRKVRQPIKELGECEG